MKQKQKVAAGTKEKAAKGRRNAFDLMNAVVEQKGIDKILPTLTEAEVDALIETTGEQSKAVKFLEAQIKAGKDLLKGHAKKKKWTERRSARWNCSICPVAKAVTGTVREFLRLLQKEKKGRAKALIDHVLSVKLTDAKKILGEDMLESEGWLKFDTDEFGKIFFIRMKK